MGLFLFVQVVPFVWYMAFATFPAGILGSFPYKSIAIDQLPIRNYQFLNTDLYIEKSIKTSFFVSSLAPNIAPTYI
jgi:hypothetical protein